MQASIQAIDLSTLQYSIPSNFVPLNTNYIETYNLNVDNGNKKLTKKFKRYDNLKCVVCGDASSGFHYGAYTCEACKLFFIRSEKHNREFPKCTNGNCVVSVEKRKSCSSCRYKSCIANGMDLSKSKFGRHTSETKSNDINHVPNISSALIDTFNNLHNSINVSLELNFQFEISGFFTNFYEKCLSLLSVTKKQSSLSRYNSNSNFESDSKSMFLNETEDRTAKCVFLEQLASSVYVKLFSVHANNVIKLDDQFSNDLQHIINEIKDFILNGEFQLPLKIMTFIFILNFLVDASKNETKFIKDNACKKRLIDLMKSEFALLKFNSNENEDSLDVNSGMIKQEFEKQGFKYPEYMTYFNMFLCRLYEIECLINQHLMFNY